MLSKIKFTLLVLISCLFLDFPNANASCGSERLFRIKVIGCTESGVEAKIVNTDGTLRGRSELLYWPMRQREGDCSKFIPGNIFDVPLVSCVNETSHEFILGRGNQHPYILKGGKWIVNKDYIIVNPVPVSTSGIKTIPSP